MALILGHSKVKYMHQYVRSDRITTLSFPGTRIRDLLEQGSVFDVIPDVTTIVVMAGGNDIPRLNAEEIVSDLLRLRDKILSVNPSATIIVSEILPRAMDEFPGARTTPEFIARYNGIADDVNRRLMKICGATEGMRFVTVPGFTNRTGVVRSMLSRDGLHLSPEGTRRVVRAYEGTISADWKARESRPLNGERRPNTHQTSYEMNPPSSSETVSQASYKMMSQTTPETTSKASSEEKSQASHTTVPQASYATTHNASYNTVPQALSEMRPPSFYERTPLSSSETNFSSPVGRGRGRMQYSQALTSSLPHTQSYSSETTPPSSSETMFPSLPETTTSTLLPEAVMPLSLSETTSSSPVGWGRGQMLFSQVLTSSRPPASTPESSTTPSRRT